LEGLHAERPFALEAGEPFWGIVRLQKTKAWEGERVQEYEIPSRRS